MTTDPFGTQTLRERVLASWVAAPVRFREDANAEEELVHGGYRDRVVVELAQNAADAASRAGAAGRLLLRVDQIGGRSSLLAANTGAPLNAEGVLSLATLRASSKRGEPRPVVRWPDTGPAGAGPAGVGPPAGVGSGEVVGNVGRFGVGFSAVLAVTDDPVIFSRCGGVRFSAGDTRDLVTQAAGHSGGLAEELARRSGHVPVLRLPFPAEGVPPAGYDTAALLPLRDTAAEDLILRLLDEVGDALLLALPGLTEITVVAAGREPRTVSDVETRWQVLRRAGELDAAVLADRPTEERARRNWSVTWAIPREPVATATPAVVHAPTPSDEPLPWPALLVATFPLDSSRRHVAPGPATDAIVRYAAAAYAELLAGQAAGGTAPWRLVPVGLPAGWLDAALRVEAMRLLPGTPLLPDAGDPTTPPRLLAPRDAVVVEPPAGADAGVVAVLAPRLAGLVHAPRGVSGVLAALGIRTVTLADAVEQLPATNDAAGWRRVYQVLAGLADDPLARESLAALPVPLADGRVVRGARGLLLPVGPVETAEALGALGLRAVPSQAAHPLLERLGAVSVDARGALDLPAVRELVATAAQDDPTAADGFPAGPLTDLVTGSPTGSLAGSITEAVLTLVRIAVDAGTLGPGELPYLADLWLADAAGDARPAGALVLPGSVAEQVLDVDEATVVEASSVQRWGARTLAAAGVLDGLAVLRREGVPLDPDFPDRRAFPEGCVEGRVTEPSVGREDPRDLDAWEDWVGVVLASLPADDAGPVDAGVVELIAVQDLELVRDDAWPQVLAMLAEDPRLRPAVTVAARIRAWVAGGGESGGASPGSQRTVTVDVPSYTAWWLARELAAGRVWADPEAEPGLAALLPSAPPLLAGLDPGMRRALGAVTFLEDLDTRAVQTLADTLADPEVELDASIVVQAWAVLTELADGFPAGGVEPADRVRVLDGAGSRVVSADEAVVVDDPVLLQRRDLGLPVLAGGPRAAAALSRLLDLPLAADLVGGVVEEDADPGKVVGVPVAVQALVPAAPTTWCEHDRLTVDGVEVQWWVELGGEEQPTMVHASTIEGLAHGLAWAGDVWQRRAAVAEVLVDPALLGRFLAEEVFVSSAGPGSGG